MATIIKFGMFTAIIVLLLSSYGMGQLIIQRVPRKGRPIVDILAVASGSVALLVAFSNFTAITHVRDDKIEFFYNVFAEPSPFIILLAIALVSISLGLSLAKRIADYRTS